MHRARFTGVLLAAILSTGPIAAAADTAAPGIHDSHDPHDPHDCARADLAAAAWKPVAGQPGRFQAVLWGDAASGARGTLEKWAPGSELELRAEGDELRATVVAGAPSLAFGRMRIDLAQGSAITVFASRDASASCTGAADCVVCVERPAPGAKAAGQPAPAAD